MKRNAKKIISLLLALTVFVSSAPAAVAAEKTPADASAKEQQTSGSEKLKIFQAGYVGKVPAEGKALRGASYSTADIYKFILSSMRKMDTGWININKYKLTRTRLKSIASNVVNENPDLYYVSDGYNIIYKGSYVEKVKWSYTVSKAAKNSMDTKFKAAVNKAMSRVNSKMSKLEKAMVLHDYLTETITQTPSSNPKSHVHDVYGAFVDKKASFIGYTLAYYYLMGKIGVGHKYTANTAGTHFWNLVNINNKWYNVDVTADDVDFAGAYSRENFLISNEELLFGAPAEKVSVDNKYDGYYWRFMPSKIYYNSGKWGFGDAYGNYYEVSKLDNQLSNNNIKKSIEGGFLVTKAGNDYIYMNSKDENKIYKMSGNAETVLHDAGYGMVAFHLQGDSLIYSYAKDWNVKKADTSTFNYKSTKPVINTLSAASYKQINISWSPSGGNAASDVYEVWRSTDKKKFTKLCSKKFLDSNRTYKDTGIKTGVTYYYKVSRVSGGKKTDSSLKAVKTLPTASKITYAKAPAYNKVLLKWSKSSGAYGYTVYRATSAKGKYKAIKHTRSLSYTDSKLDTGRKYYYKVRPYSLSTKVYGSYSGYKTVKPVLASIKKASAKKKGRTTAKISWSKVSGASGYEVYKSTKKTKGYKKIKTTKSSSYTYKKCTKKKRNYFRIRAYRKVKGKKVYTGYKTVSVKM